MGLSHKLKDPTNILSSFLKCKIAYFVRFVLIIEVGIGFYAPNR